MKPLSNPHALGNTDAEHERLMWQAERIAPFTERLFREAGIGPGARVLDIGSGVGDVSLLLAGLVGASGEVVGIERDSRSIALARSRVAQAGLLNVSFVQSDVSHVSGSEPFDAVVGRFILMWLQDPVLALRSASRVVRRGGVVAFQEPSWAPTLALSLSSRSPRQPPCSIEPSARPTIQMARAKAEGTRRRAPSRKDSVMLSHCERLRTVAASVRTFAGSLDPPASVSS
jgi:ubiquinone/menaquinone biosynthesis C-methylase UbiE